MSATERAQLLRDFDADGPEKVRENISLNRYDRRTLARAVLWLEQRDRDRSAALAPARRREDQAAAEKPRLAKRTRWPAWIAAAIATIIVIAAASVVIARNGG